MIRAVGGSRFLATQQGSVLPPRLQAVFAPWSRCTKWLLGRQPLPRVARFDPCPSILGRFLPGVGALARPQRHSARGRRLSSSRWTSRLSSGPWELWQSVVRRFCSQLFLAWCVSVLRPVPMQPCLGAYASAALKKQAACCRCFSRWHGRCHSSSGLASLPYLLVFALFFDTNSTPRADVVARRSSSVQTSQSLTVHRRWTQCGRTSPCRRTRCRRSFVQPSSEGPSRLLGQRRAHCTHCDELQERMFGVQAARAPRYWGLAGRVTADGIRAAQRSSKPVAAHCAPTSGGVCLWAASVWFCSVAHGRITSDTLTVSLYRLIRCLGEQCGNMILRLAVSV